MSTPKLGIEVWLEGNTEPDLIFNQLAYLIDALLQGNVLDADLTVPPSSPADGAAYIVAASATGEWAGHSQSIAVWNGAGWVYYAPVAGWSIYVADVGASYSFDGSAWVLGAGGIPDAPSDGTGYVRKDGAWVAESAGGGGPPVAIQLAVSDETTALTAGTAKLTFRAPYAFTLTGVRASLAAASSSGAPTFDVNVNGTSALSTKLTVDSGETTSQTAATPPVISSGTIADDDIITVDIDAAGTGAAGAKITLLGTYP